MAVADDSTLTRAGDRDVVITLLAVAATGIALEP